MPSAGGLYVNWKFSVSRKTWVASLPLTYLLTSIREKLQATSELDTIDNPDMRKRTCMVQNNPFIVFQRIYVTLLVKQDHVFVTVCKT